MTPEEAELDLEKRSRATQKARAHVVTLGRCPCCGTRLAAGLVAEIKRGDASCPKSQRYDELSREAQRIILGSVS